ncbi:hypothetical protein FRX31_007421 [Thalictrum thalictroides]|uniref:Uncharacterized protein n=1 Tax=Thalictrum thalictroides TaxID=46969 RepID=A0A7J6X2T1_THATH|nr:hypothetical protein FRX31_007421 [Thalictrum thalictroides]
MLSKIGHSFEFCHKRRSPPKDKEPQDGGATNQIHIRKPVNQVQSRPQQQPKTWQAPKGRKLYRPVVNHPEGEGTSGTKDSLGREIPSPAIHNDNQVPSPEKNHASEPANNKVSNLPVTTSNTFAVLESYEDQLPLHGQEHNTTLTTISPGYESFMTEESPQIRVEDTGNLVHKESINEGVASPARSSESRFQEVPPPALIPALAQVSHSQVMDMQLQMHDNVFLFPPNPPLLTYGGPDGEEEESYNNRHAVVTYGSDSEVIVKAKKAVPPLSILTSCSTAQWANQLSTPPKIVPRHAYVTNRFTHVREQPISEIHPPFLSNSSRKGGEMQQSPPPQLDQPQKQGYKTHEEYL